MTHSDDQITINLYIVLYIFVDFASLYDHFSSAVGALCV